MNFDPQNILLINLGQIGDVILSLPAMRAVREKFAEKKITALVGKSARGIVEMSGLFDEIVSIDRGRLKRGRKLWAIRQILQLIADIRRRQFDFVIDLHSLYETNLLGFVAGADQRLFASRANRSLDFLSNFRPKPPKIDRSLHLTDYYLQNLRPLGIKNAPKFFQITPDRADLEMVKDNLLKNEVDGKEIVGIHLGAGNPSRMWDFDKFARLAEKVSKDEKKVVFIFYGPEEKHLEKEIKDKFPPEAIIVNGLNLQQLAAAYSYIKVLIGNDTGPLHLAAVVGVPVVVIMDENAPLQYLPLGDNVHVVQTAALEEISVADVFQATQTLL